MIRYSVIIPVYNRPHEVKELLQSLREIQRDDWEILIVEDGSAQSSEEVIREFDSLPIQYFTKDNTGQGFTRNWASEKAKGDFLVFFDSDCLIPPNYFDIIDEKISQNDIDAWGGPDKAHPDFSLLQKAVGFTMSSILTTGGIRGKRSVVGKFHPRTFNMGIRRSVFSELGGFKKTNMGEDIEFSTRMIKAGHKSILIEEAFVYHKRRETLDQFINQAYRFGKSRVINSRLNSGSLKLVHLFPVGFGLGFLAIPFLYLIHPMVFLGVFGIYLFYFLLVWIASLIEYKSLAVSLISIPVAFLQLFSYGTGIVVQLFRRSS